MKKTGACFYLIVLFTLLLGGCRQEEVVHPLKIAISKGVPEKSYKNYYNWLKKTDSTVIIEDMYHLSYDSALLLLAGCDALLIPGGTDIYPENYGKDYDSTIFWKPDFKRDSLELMLIAAAKKSGMPVMGICRGLQILNVEDGGTLIADIPRDLGSSVIHRTGDGYDCYHPITVDTTSLLFEISGQKRGEVNSAHHQGIDILAKDFELAAVTEDCLIESIEYINWKKHPFLLGVQWHPERLDYENPFSGNIAVRFLKEAEKFKTNRHHE